MEKGKHQGSLLKGIDSKNLIFFKNYFLNGNYLWPTLFVKVEKL